MTRRRDLMCEDIFGCNHLATLPVSQDGEIVAWVCGCGARKVPNDDPRTAHPLAEEQEKP